MKSHFGIALGLLLYDVLLCDAQGLLNTGYYQRRHIDGPGGTCKLWSSIKFGIPVENSEVECRSGWVKNQTYSADKVTMPNRRKCKYYKKSVTFFCHDTSQENTGPVTCIRNIIFYFITSACSKYWLNWEECDKTCGGGTSARVRIAITNNIYQTMTDYRTCNTHACPQWTPWRPSNDTEPCDITTCTRIWKRDCVFNNTATNPSLCGDQYYEPVFNISNNNSTHRMMPCFVHECARQTTSIPSITTDLTSATRTIGPFLRESFKNNEVTSIGKNNIWLGIGIGFAISMCAFLLGCLIVHRSRHSCLRSKHNRANVYEHRSSLASEHRMSLNIGVPPPPPITPLGSIEDISAVPFSEAIYCTVSSKTGVVDSPLLQQESNGANGVSIAPNQISTSKNHIDSAYSDEIILRNPPDELSWRQNVLAPAENNDCLTYSSSEFDECSERKFSRSASFSETAEDKSVGTHANLETKEDGCKSFDSDEDRDVVHTLRKPLEKLKSKHLLEKNDLDDVFSSDEEELLREDHDNLRKSEFNARYSKLAAKKSRLTHSHCTHDTKGNRSAESEFQFILGNQHTSTTSESSVQAEAIESQQVGRGHQKLSCHSSGTSSVVSFNMDVATSGYNSALGESTDDDFFIRNKKPPPSGHRKSSLRATFSYQSNRQRQAQQKWKNSSLRSCHTEHHHMINTNLDHGTAKSLFNPKISRFHDMNHEQQTNNGTLMADPWPVMYPGHSHSLSLPGHGSHASRAIEMEDVYSAPIDSKPSEFKEVIYMQYDVPIDSIKS